MKNLRKVIDKQRENSRRRRFNRQFNDINVPERRMWSDSLERELLRSRF
jgi:hypothetical protein